MVLTLESRNKILLIYQSNETSLVVARVDYIVLLEMPSFLFGYYRSKWTQSTQSINLNFAVQYSFIECFLILCTFKEKKTKLSLSVAFQEILRVRVSGFLTKHMYSLGGGEGGGGEFGHPDIEIRGAPVSNTFFLDPAGLKITGGVGPSSGSTTDTTQFKVTLVKECTFNREVAFLGPSPQTNCSRATVWGCSSKRFGSTPTSFTTVTNSS